MYSRLIHTVDHVEGILRPEFDALDGFLSHAWAVTVTGAPKLWAIRFIEEEERSSRRWYGGAIGRLTFDGNMNTGLTLRTIRMQDGIAETRVGATLLYDSDPIAEEDETELKAAALFSAIRGPGRLMARPGRLLRGLPERFTIGRYHSLYAVRSRLPAVLSVVAETEDDQVVMAIEHRSLAIAAVQFHPESVMTSPGEIGMPIIEAALAL